MRKKKNKNKKIISLLLNQKGMALLTTLIFVFILVTFAIALLIMTSNDTKLSALQRDSTKAFYIAEAGIQDAISRLVNGTVSDTGNETVTDWNVDNSYSSTGFNNTFTIKHRLTGSPSAVDMNPTTGKPYYIITSTGISETAKKTIEVVVSLIYPSPFEKALIGCNGVSFKSNGKTSSYSSAGNPVDGKKGDIATTSPNADITLASNAEIKGNVRATGNLIMESNAKVQKSAYANGNINMSSNAKIGTADTTPPYSYEAMAGENIILGSNAQIYGTQSQNTSPPPVPPESCDPLNINDLFTTNAAPIQETNNNAELHTPYFNGSSYSCNNSDTIGVTDQSKEYYLTSFSTNSNSVVTIQGNVTLYVNGNFSMNSNSEIKLASGAKLTIYVTGNFTLDSNTQINNNTDLDNQRIPSNLMIYSNAQSASDTDYKLSLNSNSGFRGVVYAPGTAVEINSNAHIYGSVRGSFVSMNSNGEFHYDEELSKTTGGSGNPNGYSLVYWREII